MVGCVGRGVNVVCDVCLTLPVGVAGSAAWTAGWPAVFLDGFGVSVETLSDEDLVLHIRSVYVDGYKSHGISTVV
jgi:hypothetical protein